MNVKEIFENKNRVYDEVRNTDEYIAYAELLELVEEIFNKMKIAENGYLGDVYYNSENNRLNFSACFDWCADDEYYIDLNICDLEGVLEYMNNCNKSITTYTNLLMDAKKRTRELRKKRDAYNTINEEVPADISAAITAGNESVIKFNSKIKKYTARRDSIIKEII